MQKLKNLNKYIGSSYDVARSDQIYFSTHVCRSSNIYDSSFIYNSKYLLSCFFCTFSERLKNCLFCAGIDNQEFCIFNTKVEEDIFYTALEELRIRLQAEQVNITSDKEETFLSQKQVFSKFSKNFKEWLKLLPNYSEDIINLFFLKSE